MCVNLNRSFIGIELNDNYFKIAEERINKIKRMYSGRFKPKPVENEYGVFDSKSEYERYSLLLDMERNGLITDLKRQVTYELLSQQTKVVRKALKTKVKEVVKVVEQDMKYTCDFTCFTIKTVNL